MDRFDEMCFSEQPTNPDFAERPIEHTDWDPWIIQETKPSGLIQGNDLLPF